MTRWLPNPSHARAITRIELVRVWRQAAGQGAMKLIALAISALFLLALTLGAGVAGFFAGGLLGTGELPIDPVTGGQYVVAALVLLGATITLFRTVTESARIDAEAGMLTTVPYRDVAAGLLGKEYAYLLVFLAPATLALSVGLAVGAGSPATALLVAVALLAASTTAFLAGAALGYALANAFARFAVLARNRLAVGALVFVVYMALIVSNTFAVAVEPVVTAFGRSPVAWYADLALLAVAPDASVARAAGSLAATAVLAPLLAAAAIRLAGALWYADPVATDDGAAESSTLGGATAGALAGALAAVVGRPAARVAAKAWLRARRAPLTVAFVAYPLFVLTAPVTETIQTGTVSAALPTLLGFYGAWATGAAFTLNPLGNEGVVLPVTVTSGVSGREFVGGTMAAGLVLGLPATVVLAVVLGVLSPLGLAQVVGVAGVSAVLCVAATAIAAAAGMAFPKYDAVRVTRSRRAVIPSLFAFAAYSLALGVVALPGLVVQYGFVVELLGDLVGAAPGTIRLAGVAVSLALAGLAAYPSFRYATAQFDGYAT